MPSHAVLPGVGSMASLRRGTMPTLRWRKLRQTPIACGLIVSALLLLGCSQTRAVPDPSVPHRLSRDTDMYQWVRLPDGKVAEQLVRVPAGWWVASPLVVEAGK